MQTQFVDPKVSFASYDFVIITSKRTIEALQKFHYSLEGIKVYCIGEKTAAYAKAANMVVVHTSVGYAKNLMAEISSKIAGQKGLYLRPKTVANSYITEYVYRGKLDEAICYETLCCDRATDVLTRPATLLFAAPSQVECFMKHFSFEDDDAVVVIGQTTADALPEDIKYEITAQKSLESLVQTALKY